MRINTEPKEVKVKTVEKTLKLLEILAENNGPIPLTRLGQMSNLSLSTAHRLLNTLCRNGFVERERVTGHYKLGIKAFLIGNAALQNVDLRPTALPYLSKLAEKTNESTYLAILTHQDVIYSDSVKTSGPIQFGIQTGIPIPAFQTNSGKVLLAYLPNPDLQTILEIYRSQNLITDLSKLVEELQTIKESGFSTGITELGSSIKEISAPIFNHLKICVGAVSIFVTGRYDQEQEAALNQEVIKTAFDISNAMGFRINPKEWSVNGRS